MLQNQKGSTNWYVGYVSFFWGARTWFLGKVTKIDFQALSDLAPASQSLHSVDADSGT